MERRSQMTGCGTLRTSRERDWRVRFSGVNRTKYAQSEPFSPWTWSSQTLFSLLDSSPNHMSVVYTNSRLARS